MIDRSTRVLEDASGISDREIDDLVREALRAIESPPSRPDPPNRGSGRMALLPGWWCMLVFLAGMTAMEGLRYFLLPVQTAQATVLRCAEPAETIRSVQGGTPGSLP